MNLWTSYLFIFAAWGRLARWQFNERVGEVITLMGSFVVVGKLAGSVFDGQDVRCPWDVDNSASFSLIRHSSDDTSECPDETWLYNRFGLNVIFMEIIILKL